jgi:hypothetical protein
MGLLLLPSRRVDGRAVGRCFRLATFNFTRLSLNAGSNPVKRLHAMRQQGSSRPPAISPRRRATGRRGALAANGQRAESPSHAAPIHPRRRRFSMLMQILTHTPFFVWALLAGLVALGLMQSRTRQVAWPRVVVMPALFLGLGLWSVLPGMSALPLVAALWLAALAAGTVLGRRTPQAPGTVWLADVGRFVLPGSWIPMGFIGVIFTLRYVSSVSMALHPELRTDFGLQAAMAMVFGLLTGLSIGRTLELLRLRRPGAATIGAHA